MKVLAINVPFIKHVGGQIHTGPNAGSRWPWTMPGPTFHGYAPYPFYLANAISWLRHHGITSDIYDGVADCHANIETTKKAIIDYRPSVAVFDVSTPVFPLITEVASYIKKTIESIIVFVGPHMKAYADDCKKLPYVDHCVVGEYEVPLLDIVNRYPGGKGIYRYEHVNDINHLPDGSNFVPYRDLTRLGRYYDPSMQTARTQLQVSASRGCPFKCTYCAWPNTLNGGSYRARRPDVVIDEIKQVKTALGNSLGSIFFDDDTWNLGNKRITEMCKGLKDIGLPWTMMGRIDTSSHEVYDTMVNSGCRGMRFGIESFNQQLLDNAKKNLDARVTYDNIKYLLTRFSGLEFHFTTLSNMPGSVKEDVVRDREILAGLIKLGNKNKNIVHYQCSEVVPFPGTELWDELIQLGYGDSLSDFNKYDGHPDHNDSLIKVVGLLGGDYKPKPSKYSGTGAPTNLPKD